MSTVMPGQVGFVCAPADLAITVTANVDSLLPGGQIVYTAVVTNNGPLSVQAAPVTATANRTLTQQSWTCAVGSEAPITTSCGASKGEGALSDQLNLDPANSATYKVTATLAQGQSGKLTYTTSVAAPQSITDPDPNNNTASVNTNITTTADLSVQIAAPPPPLYAGQTVPFTVTVPNAGPDDAEDAKLVFTLPARTTLAATPTADDWTCTPQGQKVTCLRPSIAAATSATLSVGVNPDPALTSITVTAAVSATTDDPNLSNNMASATASFAPQKPTLNGGGFGCAVAAPGRGAASSGLGLFAGWLLLGLFRRSRSSRRIASEKGR
jgi:uncharacterized repeat protein (TIGR01451 family)